MRKFLLPLLLSVAFLVACAPNAAEIQPCDDQFQQSHLPFIITATHRELLAVSADVENGTACQAGDLVFHPAIYQGSPLVYFESGVGPGLSANSAESAIKSFPNMTVLVFSGSAGGLDPNFPVGTTVIAKKWIDLESGITISTPDNLLALAEKIDNITIADYGITTNYFVTNGTEVYNQTGASIVDMETFSVATIADFHQIPFTAVRTVSDMADGEKSSEKFENADEASAKAALDFLIIFSTENP